MLQFKKHLSGLLATCLVAGSIIVASSGTIAAASTPGNDEWATVSNILDQYKINYNAPSTISNTTDKTPDGPLMGNGTVMAFMGGDKKKQNIYISRTDMWEDNNVESARDVHFTTFGGLSISSSTTTSGTFKYEQDMKTAELLATSESGFQTKTWLSAKENLLVTEISNMTDSALSLDVSAWTAPPTSNTISTVSAGNDIANGMIYAVKNAKSNKYNWSVNAAVATKVLNKTPEYAKVDDHTYKMTFSLSGKETVTVVSAVEGGKGSSTYLDDAKNKVLSRSDAASIATAEEAHLNWWKAFWLKSYIDLAPQSNTLEKLYYGRLYQLGCGIAAQSENNAGLTAPLFPWTGNANPAWSGDYTLNTDIQRAMHVSIVANRTDHITNYSNVIKDFWEAGRRLASDPVKLNQLISGTGHPSFTTGIRGVLYPTHLGPWGSRTENFNGPNDYFHSPSNAASSLVPLVKYWRYTQDDQYLTNVLYPELKDLAQFWEDYVVWDAQTGKYVVYGATFEGSSGHKNAILDLSAAHFVFESAIEASVALGVDAASRATWQNILDKLSPYPTKTISSGPGAGKVTFVEDDGAAPQSYNNPEVIHGSYFFNTIGMSDVQNSEYVRNFIQYLQTWDSDKAMRAAVAATTVGYDIEKIVNNISSNIINTPVSDWTGMRNNNTYGDLGASIYMGFIQNSLLQSDENFIHIFPNWYKDQEASFTRLRANGAFLVDAKQNNLGQATYVKILSEKGKDLAVLNPWKGQDMEVYEDGMLIGATKSTNSLGELYTLVTKANSSYELKPKGGLRDITLVSITTPQAIVGLEYGTAKSAAALGLPEKIALVTDGGTLKGGVTWDLSGTSYDPTAVTGQTFTVPGTVTLPIGVTNPNNVPLTTSISVTVNPATLIPGKIEAENYSNMSGIQTEDSSEGTKDVGWTDPGDWMDYVVNVQKSGLYKVDYRAAGNSGTGIVNFLVDGVSNKITSLPSTGGWQNWKTVSDKVTLSAGKHTIRLAINTGGWNLNWFELSEVLPTNLTSITAPAAITGVTIGTAKTAVALGLPVNAVLVTDTGNVDASVSWDLSNINYDPTIKTAQIFTVPGTVTLPSGVTNTNNVPLTTSISVTVNKIPSSQMTATATSQETAGENDAASMAIDGNPGTIWHTKWNKSDVLPQSITLDLGGTYNINSILYLPRPSGTNGIITSYNVYASTDGVSFTKVANGNWANDNTKKIATFVSTNASYVKLEATVGANGFASAAEIGVTAEPSVVPNLMSITAPAAITGLPNGTAKTAAALGLPATVELVTNTGSVNANVAWNVDGSSYDPAVRTQQTFTVSGTVTLPAGVVNPNNVALTTSVSVTVLAAPATPKSTLTGVQQVLSGQPFTLTMGLTDVTQSVFQSVYGQDFTLQYDPASVQFDSVTSLKDGFQVIDTKETPGQLRIVAASVGANVPAQGDLLAIKFKAKSVTQATSTTISVDHVVIANGQGNELQLGGASREIQITVPAIPVDKSLLNATIISAQAKYAAAVEGNGDGLYAIGSKAQLQSAIDAAQAAVNNSNATQQQVDSAKVALEAAVQVFESKKITADINGGGISIGDLASVAVAYGKQQGQAGWNEKADVNHDGKVDIVDLAIVAKAILQ